MGVTSARVRNDGCEAVECTSLLSLYEPWNGSRACLLLYARVTVPHVGSRGPFGTRASMAPQRQVGNKRSDRDIWSSQPEVSRVGRV